MGNVGNVSEVKISVRRLVEFLLRSGDIDNRRGKMTDPAAMQEGSAAHRRLQKDGGSRYLAEVPLAVSFPYKGAGDEQETGSAEPKADQLLPDSAASSDQPPVLPFVLTVEGRADGIIPGKDLFTIDEIKGIYRDIWELDEPYAVHQAQADCYAYMLLSRLKAGASVNAGDKPAVAPAFAVSEGFSGTGVSEDQADKKKRRTKKSSPDSGAGGKKDRQTELFETAWPQEKLDKITVQITYVNLESGQVRRFRKERTFDELEEWFLGLVHEYRRWAAFLIREAAERSSSIGEMEFPYPYREGQKRLVSAVYRTIEQKKNLFIQAPTGTGKTLAVLYPALKAIGNGMGTRLFYLTARTITRTAAEDTFDLLRAKGLRFRTVTLMAREKFCLMKPGAENEAADIEAEFVPPCNPEECPYAKGHFDRINDCLYEMVTQRTSFTREEILAQARKWKVCPADLALDLTAWADGVICDYNYLFDPTARLSSFFGANEKGGYIFLVDEAHNLVDRGRGMYSASLRREEFLEVRRALKKSGGAKSLVRALDVCCKWMLSERRLLDAAGEAKSPARRELPDAGSLTFALMNLSGQMEEYLEEEHPAETADAVRKLYFEVTAFNAALERMTEKYRLYTETIGTRDLLLRVFCMDPSTDLSDCMKKGRSTVLFSATLLPLDYYRRLITGNTEDYAVYASTCFNPSNRRVLIGADTSTRYTMRGASMYAKFAEYIRRVSAAKKGNYMVFFPSYAMMKEVADIFARICPPGTRVLQQTSRMSEAEREAFLNEFRRGESEAAGDGIQNSRRNAAAGRSSVQETLLGFCVMGSFFGEGIDLRKDSLIGVIVVGCALPQVGTEQEILQEYYSGQGLDGFRYAYICPGMNKVLQAAGRVIRTEEDRGVVILLDERFLQNSYRSMFPREWDGAGIVSLSTVERELDAFWDVPSESE